jgi:hypothetical protein
MEEFYDSLKSELLARNAALKALTKHSKLKGDYTEALVRDVLRRLVPQKYKVGHGIVYNAQTGDNSGECDVIIYDVSEAAPLFESQDLVIVDAKHVRIVMQVKSTLDSSAMKDAIENMREVKKVRRDILGWVFGFKNNVMLRTLYLQAWKSHVIQFVQILETKCKTEDKVLLSNQMAFLGQMVRYYTSSICPTGIDSFVVYDDQNHGVHFQQRMEEKKVKEGIARIYSLGFWKCWETEK